MHSITPKLRIVNATWYMPNSKKNAWAEHLEERIHPNTVFFNHDEICDKSSTLPHTLPSSSTFTAHMKKLNIPIDSDIVC